MPSSWNWLLGGLALLLGMASPLRADPSAATEPTLPRAAVEDIVQRTVSIMNCKDWCGPQPTCYRWEAAIEVPILRPYFDDFSNGSVIADQNGENFEAETEVEPEYSLTPSVRGWLSFVGEGGFGGRIRYWHFDADSEDVLLPEIDLESGEQTGAVGLRTALEMNVLDLEALCRRQWRCWIVEAGAGLRYARLQHQRNFLEIDVEEGEFQAVTQTQSTFEGWGPTGVLEGRRTLIGGLSAFINGRASLLAGRSRIESVADFNNGDFLDFDVQRTDHGIVVLESQIGLEYAWCRGCYQPFVRACAEAQWWLDGGHVLEGGFDDSPHDDLSFFGLTLTAGIRR